MPVYPSGTGPRSRGHGTRYVTGTGRNWRVGFEAMAPTQGTRTHAELTGGRDYFVGLIRTCAGSQPGHEFPDLDGSKGSH